MCRRKERKKKERKRRRRDDKTDSTLNPIQPTRPTHASNMVSHTDPAALPGTDQLLIAPGTHLATNDMGNQTGNRESPQPPQPPDPASLNKLTFLPHTCRALAQIITTWSNPRNTTHRASTCHESRITRAQPMLPTAHLAQMCANVHPPKHTASHRTQIPDQSRQDLAADRRGPLRICAL